MLHKLVARPRASQVRAPCSAHRSADSAPALARMQVSAVTTRTELEAIAPEWNVLLQDSRADTIFLTWEYISSWLDAVAPHAEPLVLVARDESGRLVGIAPFYRRQIRLRGFLTYRCLCTLGDHSSPAEYPDLIVRRDQEESVLAALGAALGRRRDWD